MSKIIASAIAGAVALTTAGGVTMANVLNRDDVTISVDGVSREAKVHPGTVQESWVPRASRWVSTTPCSQH